jgi:hypothetical protein
MSEVDLESQDLSEDESGSEEKLVPVGEAIRYRKRAQNAEKEVSVLSEQLKKTEKKNEQLAGELDEIRLDQKLVQRLSSAGVSDLEMVLLVAKARVKSSDEADVDQVIEQLKKEKGYLFDGAKETSVSTRTAGVKERKPSGQRVLEKAAKRAAESGNRADVQEYLKVRRQFV